MARARVSRTPMTLTLSPSISAISAGEKSSSVRITGCRYTSGSRWTAIEQSAALAGGDGRAFRRRMRVGNLVSERRFERLPGSLRDMRDCAKLRDARDEGFERGVGAVVGQCPPYGKPHVLRELAREVAIALIAGADTRHHGLVLGDQRGETGTGTHEGVLTETIVSGHVFTYRRFERSCMSPRETCACQAPRSAAATGIRAARNAGKIPPNRPIRQASATLAATRHS